MGHDAVELRVDAQDELPGEGLVRALAPLGAELQVVVDRVAERLDDLRGGIRLEGDDVAEADHAPEEDAMGGLVDGTGERAFEADRGVDKHRNTREARSPFVLCKPVF